MNRQSRNRARDDRLLEQVLNAHAQLAVDGKLGKYSEFKGAETYINVGEAMGKAMVELVKNE